MQQVTSSQVDKILKTLYKLNESDHTGHKFPIEDITINAWKTYPSEFCIRGYKEYPDIERIRRIVSTVVSKGYAIGNVSGYKITQKGIDYVKNLELWRNKEKAIRITDTSEATRLVHEELSRIMSSKVFRDYTSSKINGTDLELLESDLFQFLGTSPRSLSSVKEKTQLFLPKYRFMVNELIPFCKINAKTDKSAEMIVELWDTLFKKFGKLVTGE